MRRNEAGATAPDPSLAKAVLVFLCGLLLFFIPAIVSLQRDAATFDEPVYIIAGLAALSLHDFTMKDDAPPLIPYLAGLSALSAGLTIPGGRLGFRDSLREEYPFASWLLYRSGKNADRILFRSRLMVLVPFGLLLLGSVFFWSRSLFGLRGAGLSLLLVALSPNLIAHGRLVAADVPCAAAMLLASFLLWRWTVAPTARRALVAGLGLGLALAVKYTALLLIPTLGLVVLLKMRGAGRRATRIPSPPLHHALWILVPAFLVVALIYGLPPQLGRYVTGITRLYRNLRPDYAWYLFGRFHAGGVPYYYLAVLAVKVALPLLILGVGSLFWIRRRTAGPLAEMCLWLPAAALLVASAFDPMPAGIRRVIPLLPVLAVSAGRWFPRDRSWKWRGAAPIGILAAWMAVTSLASASHYLAYFNEAAGGWRNGHRLLDDSNLDWGQDLNKLPRALARMGVEGAWLSYFGTADPAYYGLGERLASPDRIARPEPGVYAISLHNAIRMELRGIRWPLEREPDARAGSSILIFRIP